MHRERNERRTFGQVKNDEQEKVVSFVDIWSAEKCGTVLWCHTLNFRLFRVGVDLQ
jgi:hypothetical protein